MQISIYEENFQIMMKIYNVGQLVFWFDVTILKKIFLKEYLNYRVGWLESGLLDF